jgi:hypothetical protein
VSRQCNTQACVSGPPTPAPIPDPAPASPLACKVGIVSNPTSVNSGGTSRVDWKMWSGCDQGVDVYMLNPSGQRVTGGIPNTSGATFCKSGTFVAYEQENFGTYDTFNYSCTTVSLSSSGTFTPTIDGYKDDLNDETHLVISRNAPITVGGVSSDISVISNISAPWSISPGGYSGTGGGLVSVTPSGLGTTYTISPGTVSGYAWPPTIVNSISGIGSTMTLFGNESETFALIYAPGNASLDYSLTASNVSIARAPQSSPLAAVFSALLARAGAANSFAQTVVHKTLISGTTQPVNLSLSGVPSGVTYSFANQSCSPTCNETINFTIPPSVPAGTYPVTITGTPGNKTAVFNMTLGPVSGISATCTASPSSVLVGNPVTWSATVLGGTPPYTYTWTGSSLPTPRPSTSSFGITYSTVGEKTAQISVVDSVGNIGSCVAATVQVNFNPKFQEF